MYTGTADMNANNILPMQNICLLIALGLIALYGFVCAPDQSIVENYAIASRAGSIAERNAVAVSSAPRLNRIIASRDGQVINSPVASVRDNQRATGCASKGDAFSRR